MKKSDRKKLDQQCLSLWSKVVKIEQGRCQCCGSVDLLESHHIIPRTHKKGRYEPGNGLCLCMFCHGEEKSRPRYFRAMIFDAIGTEQYEGLKVKYTGEYKFTIDELKAKRKELKERML